MGDSSAMGLAAYLLAYTLVRRLQAKGVLASHDAEELISTAIRQLGSPSSADVEVAAARSILHGTLRHVQEGTPDER